MIVRPPTEGEFCARNPTARYAERFDPRPSPKFAWIFAKACWNDGTEPAGINAAAVFIALPL